MRMEPIRCHFTIILERLFKIYWQFLPALIIPVLARGALPRPWILILIFFASLVLFSIMQVVLWRKTLLYADEEQLYVTRGLLWKRQLTVPFVKINTVDLSRNLFQRMVGTCRIKIDTGSVTGKAKGDAESDLVFTLKDAERIRAHILSLSSGVASLHNEYVDLQAGADASTGVGRAEAGGIHYVRAEHAAPSAADPSATTEQGVESPLTSPRVVIRARTRDFFLYGLTQNKVLAGFAIAVWLIASAGELLGDRIYQWLGGLATNIGTIFSRFEMVAMIAAGLFLFLIYYLLANLVSVLYAIIRFYNFRVSREGEMIHVEYGLISVKSYTMPLRNIHAIIVKQNLLRQWLRQCSVELVSIGYGDEKNEVALLFPMIPLADLDDALGQLLEEYQGTRARSTAPAAARRYFLALPVIALILVTAGISYFSPQILFSLLLTLPVLIYARLLYNHHASIGYTEDRIEVTTGGFNYHEYRIRMAAVQSVSANSTWWTEKAGLKNYRIDYHAPALRAIARVRFLDEHHLGELRKLLDQ